MWGNTTVWIATVVKSVTNEQERKGKARLSENEVVMILRKFASYLVMLKVQLEKAVEIVRQCSRLYEISNKYVTELILFIYTHQFLNFETLRKKSLKIKSKRDKDSICSSLVITSIKYSIKYMNDLKELRNILLLNKKANSILRPEILKQILVRMPISDSQRLCIWHSALEYVPFFIFIEGRSRHV